jgi:hypothetical protein
MSQAEYMRIRESDTLTIAVREILPRGLDVFARDKRLPLLGGQFGDAADWLGAVR